MNKARIAVLVVAAAFLLLACSLIDRVTGGAGGGSAAADLWSDVPRMDGLTKSDIDMPIGVKLIFNTVLGNLGRLNPEGEDQSTGKVDWIVFATDKTPDDVKAFYTPALMVQNGWDATDESTCLSGADEGISQVGVFCVFQKTQANSQTQLVILTVPEEQTKKNNVFFLRLETTPTPAPPQ